MRLMRAARIQNGFPVSFVRNRTQFLQRSSSHRGLASNSFFQVSKEVIDAVRSQKPVVALETAIYTHGFPYPENVALASHLESIVRIHGGVPATVGIINGVARVGLGAQDLIDLAASAGKPGTIKVSRRDLGFACGHLHGTQKLNGGTTVSGTMVLAKRASIKVFATGGLGGVHRDGENTMDVSADLTELGRTRMIVVSSGCKSFLDIPRTLEYLETQGVGVCTFSDGREGEVDFPAFWSRDSGIKSPMTILDEAEGARIAQAHLSLQLKSSLLLANPVPAEDAIPKAEMDTIIAQAIRDAEDAGFKGSANTPYILRRIRELSQSESVSANRALIESNVIRATNVAVHLADLLRTSHGREISITIPPAASKFSSDKVPGNISEAKSEDVLVAGSLAIDTSCNYIGRPGGIDPSPRTSNIASISQSVGGVGHNVASAISYLGVSVRLCSNIGDDLPGMTAKASLTNRSMSTSGIRTLGGGARTAQYVAFNSAHKQLLMAMADMDILDSDKDAFEQTWQPYIDECKPKWLVVDANWDPTNLRKWIKSGHAAGARVAFEPVSVEKSKRLFAMSENSNPGLGVVPNPLLNLATPNTLELASMFQAASLAGIFDREDWFSVVDSFGLSSSGSREKLVYMTNESLVNNGIPQQSIQLLPLIPSILTTLGDGGVLLTQLLPAEDDRLTSPTSAPHILSRCTNGNRHVGGIYLCLFPSVAKVPPQDIQSVNGVGDTFLGAIIAGLAKDNAKSLPDLVDFAQQCSIYTLKSNESVSPAIAGSEIRSMIK